jgi:hypothetical protein
MRRACTTAAVLDRNTLEETTISRPRARRPAAKRPPNPREEAELTALRAQVMHRWELYAAEAVANRIARREQKRSLDPAPPTL